MHSKSDNLGYLKDQRCEIFQRLSAPPPQAPPAPRCSHCSLLCIYFFPDSCFACSGMSVISAHVVTNKISRDSNYVVDLILLIQFCYSSMYIREVINFKAMPSTSPKLLNLNPKTTTQKKMVFLVKSL